MKNRHLARALTAGITAAALSGLVALPAAQAAETVTIVDPGASPATRSLFSYLDDVRGEGILFGHQHTTSYGLTFTGADGINSDVKNLTGDIPAVFGWDTLIMQGDEAPGSASNTTAQNIAALDDYIAKAHAPRRHQHALRPHGELRHRRQLLRHHGRHAARGPARRREERRPQRVPRQHRGRSGRRPDAEGDLIPIIFRPWHENAGSWFWWGAAFGSPGEYKELFRYTVEYLRDVKGVSNFLYAFGPGSGFGGNAEHVPAHLPRRRVRRRVRPRRLRQHGLGRVPRRAGQGPRHDRRPRRREGQGLRVHRVRRDQRRRHHRLQPGAVVHQGAGRDQGRPEGQPERVHADVGQLRRRPALRARDRRRPAARLPGLRGRPVHAVRVRGHRRVRPCRGHDARRPRAAHRLPGRQRPGRHVTDDHPRHGPERRRRPRLRHRRRHRDRARRR